MDGWIKGTPRPEKEALSRIRASEDAARTAFEEYFPNDADGTDTTRRQVLNIIARTVIRAHSQGTGPCRWTVTLWPKQGRRALLLRINVSNGRPSPVTTLDVYGDRLEFIVPDFLPREIVQRIEEVADDGTKGSVQPFVQPTRDGPKLIGKDRMPNAQEIRIPITHLARDYPLIDAHHHAMISKYAKEEIPAGEVRDAHSRGPLLYLASELGPMYIPKAEDYNYIPYDRVGNAEIDQAIQVSFLYMTDQQAISPVSRESAPEECVSPSDVIASSEGPSLRNENVATTDAIELTEFDGQRYVADAGDRVLIERHAMDQACMYYGDTHDAEDVSQAQPKRGYDLLFRPKHNSSDRRVLHVEVKGTQKDGLQVELTANEVIHAQSCSETCGCTPVLFVVPNIVLAGEGQDRHVRAGGVPIAHEDWKPHEGLQIVRYRYTLLPISHA